MSNPFEVERNTVIARYLKDTVKLVPQPKRRERRYSPGFGHYYPENVQKSFKMDGFSGIETVDIMNNTKFGRDHIPADWIAVGVKYKPSAPENFILFERTYDGSSFIRFKQGSMFYFSIDGGAIFRHDLRYLTPDTGAKIRRRMAADPEFAGRMVKIVVRKRGGRESIHCYI